MLQVLSQSYLGIYVQGVKSLKCYKACVPRFELEVLVVIAQAVSYMKLYRVCFPSAEPELFRILGSLH